MTQEAQIRAQIVAEALSWERTPYHDHACVKGAGVDCALLPAAVYHACGIIPRLTPEYSSQWMMHRDEEHYLAEIRRWAREILPESVQPGDLMVFKFGRVFSHSAIMIDPPEAIHAAMRGNGSAVIRCNIDEEEDYRVTTRLRKAFSVFDNKGQLVKAQKT